ncbi:MAG: hypothetical protein N4A39_09180, partial [Roseicyclus sp.]|nr:hypothetical protein [Roseicyclus sp.]
KRADRVSAWLEAVQLAGFATPEADRFFGRPDPALTDGLTLVLRPPVEARDAFTARHAALMAAL